MHGYRNRKTLSIAVAAASAAIVLSGPAAAKSCAQRMTTIEAQVAAMPGGPNKHVAQVQLQKAKKFLAAGQERKCLQYLGAARGGIEAERMNNN